MQIGKSKAKVYIEKKTGVTFADVEGIDKAEEELVEVVEFLKNPQKYQRLGGRIPKGVLLLGPPGTGKTDAHQKVRSCLSSCEDALEELAQLLLEKEVVERPALQSILNAKMTKEVRDVMQRGKAPQTAVRLESWRSATTRQQKSCLKSRFAAQSFSMFYLPIAFRP